MTKEPTFAEKLAIIYRRALEIQAAIQSREPEHEQPDELPTPQPTLEPVPERG